MKARKKLSAVTRVLGIASLVALFTGLTPILAMAGVFMLSGGHLPQIPGVTFEVAVAIDAESIIAEATEYFRGGNGAESTDNFQLAIQNKRDYPGIAQLRLVKGDIVELSHAEITDVMQAFKKNWSPKGDATFTPVPFRLRRQKIDQEYTPDEIVETYFGWLKGMPEAERANWPIIRYITDYLIGPKLGANQSLVDWAGVYVAPSNNSTPGTTLGSYDGLKQILLHLLTEGTANEFTLSNDITDPTKTFSSFEEAVDMLPDAYQNEDMVILCSNKTRRNYFRDRRNTHGQDMDYALRGKDKAMKLTIDGSDNIEIIGLNGMGANNDHGWMVITPRTNLLLGRQTASYNFKAESARRVVSIMADWKEGVGVGLAEHVFVVRQGDESMSA